jgi:hypothetical protein
MAKKPDLDEPTLQLMERMLRMPPKPHDEMKLGKKRKVGPKGMSKKMKQKGHLKKI